MLAEAAGPGTARQLRLLLVPRPCPKNKGRLAQNLGVRQASAAGSILAVSLARFPCQHSPFFSLATHPQTTHRVAAKISLPTSKKCPRLAITTPRTMCL